MPKYTAPLIGVLLLTSLSVFAQSTFPKLEVASIKEVPSSDSRAYFECGAANLKISGNRISATKVTACGLISMAYVVQDYEVVDTPKWTKGGWPLTYDLQAIAEGSVALTRERARILLQVILEERFHLQFHRETREMPVYALVVGPDGPRFIDAMPSGCVAAIASNAAVSASFRMTTGPDGLMSNQPGIISICKPAPITGLARTLTMLLDRPVVDRTRLKDNYQYELIWEDRSTIFSGLQKQLGLQLVARNEQEEVMVIDLIERPSAN